MFCIMHDWVYGSIGGATARKCRKCGKVHHRSLDGEGRRCWVTSLGILKGAFIKDGE